MKAQASSKLSILYLKLYRFLSVYHFYSCSKLSILYLKPRMVADAFYCRLGSKLSILYLKRDRLPTLLFTPHWF